MKNEASINFTDALKIPNIRFFLGSVGFFTLASRAMAVVISFQIYQLTHNPWNLGWLGLIEALPTLSLVLFGGYVADHYNRRMILLITRSASLLCALFLAQLSMQHEATPLFGLYFVVFLAGVARGFADPANSAFEAQVVPKHLIVNGSSWIASTWIGCSFAGPAIIGFAFESFGAVGAYMIVSSFFMVSCICTMMIDPAPQTKPLAKEPILKSIALGWNFVFKNQALWAAMALDLFAVLFGGAMALLPIYADDILHVGARGFGLLNAAPSIGALIIMLIATHYAPQIIKHAGRNLLLTVVGFGISILIFAFSTNFYLSMTMLALSGIFDGISMVIRRSLVRLLSPDDMRGRIASVSWIFVCSSNELGAFESGMVAALIGAVPCVAVGGIVTLLVVLGAAALAPQLRNLRFDPKTLSRI